MSTTTSLNRLWFGSDWGAMRTTPTTTAFCLNRLWFGSDWGGARSPRRPPKRVSIAFGSALIGVPARFPGDPVETSQSPLVRL